MTASALALFVVLKFAGAACLLWLAWRMFGAGRGSGHDCVAVRKVNVRAYSG